MNTHALNIIVLNSGSNGNAVYVESAITRTGILLDCGISRRQIEVRLKVHGRYLYNNIPVFITHEHADHTRGLVALTKTFHPEIYLTEPTFRGIWNKNGIHGFHFIGNTETVRCGDLKVTAFPKKHDASDPVGFVVECSGTVFVYITDLGVGDSRLVECMRNADAALLEANYDPDMLIAGTYPEWLKQRVQSDEGHLSNMQAIDLIEESCDGRLRTLIFGHLSENNNNPSIVEREWEAFQMRRPDISPEMHVASRYNVSEIISI